MLMSKLIGERYKEKPGDANSISHIFLLRGGYMRQVANGIFSLLPPAKKVQRKIEQILRAEMDAIDGQEVMMPVFLPAELWRESGRYESVGSELLRIKDRSGNDMIAGMTHEEAVVHLTRTEATSYAKYPFMVYQIQTKFRDEPRARGGLIRVREFTMKDGYSFHTSQEDLERYYEECLKSYHRIFARVGLPEVISVGSDTGMMGGGIAHEFMLLNDIGEDTIVICENCGYKANMEVADSAIAAGEEAEEELREVHTPGITDIESLAEFFGVEKRRFLKSTVFAVQGSHRPLIVFTRGDLQVNEAKVKKIMNADIFPLTDYENVDLCFGFIGPYNLDVDNVDIIYDASLEKEDNLICGANKQDYHLKGLSIKRDLKIDEFFDAAKVNEHDHCCNCGGELKLVRGVEVGNIFQLGTKYTKSMSMSYLDSDGTRKHPVMGCYGIGVGRLLACIVEANHDDYGPIWPAAVAPWDIHICILNNNKDAVRDTAFELYNKLKVKYDVLMDDRGAAPGVQFADADLLGVPVRLIVSERNLKNGEIELVTRDRSVKKAIKVEELENALREMVSRDSFYRYKS
ncbi:MAG: proline--tRNA ligase [Bacillota bacterium]|nr:proline--tRNA ligase [Bacillota bacterium]